MTALATVTTAISTVLYSQKRQRHVASCQFYRLVATCQQIATNLSISSSCNKSVMIMLACHLQISYNLWKQLAASLWIKSFDNQLGTSLLTTCNRLVVNKLSQAMRAHPDINLLKTSCRKMSTDLWQNVPFWLCYYSSNNNSNNNYNKNRCNNLANSKKIMYIEILHSP